MQVLGSMGRISMVINTHKPGILEVVLEKAFLAKAESVAVQFMVEALKTWIGTGENKADTRY